MALPRDDDFEAEPVLDERTVRLESVLKPNLTFEYQYDFGDSWLQSFGWSEPSRSTNRTVPHSSRPASALAHRKMQVGFQAIRSFSTSSPRSHGAPK